MEKVIYWDDKIIKERWFMFIKLYCKNWYYNRLKENIILFF